MEKIRIYCDVSVFRILLVDSMEQAKSCLEKAYFVSDSLHEMNVKRLVLDKLIEVEEQLEPYKALRYAKDLVKMYDSMANVTIYKRWQHV